MTILNKYSVLLTEQNTWKKFSRIRKAISTEKLAEALAVHKLIKGRWSDLSQAIPIEWNMLAVEGVSRNFLDKICKEIGISTQEIDNIGFTWSVRVVPIVEDQEKGMLPSQDFISLIQQRLLNDPDIEPKLKAASKLQKKVRKIVRFKALGYLVSVPAVWEFSACYFGSLISHQALGITLSYLGIYSTISKYVSGLYNDIGTDHIKVLDKAAKRPVVDCWVESAQEIGGYKISLEHILYKELVDNKLKKRLDKNLLDRSLVKILQAIEIKPLLNIFPIEPEKIEDIDSADLNKKLLMIDHATESNLPEAYKGFVIEVRVPNSPLSGTCLQLYAFPPDNSDSDGGGHHITDEVDWVPNLSLASIPSRARRQVIREMMP